MNNPSYLYLIVTQDKYELPLFVGSVYEVAEKAGISVNSVYSSLCYFEHGKYKTCKFRRVPEKDGGD